MSTKTKHKRKIPIGWRVLTPTEKIDENTKRNYKAAANVNILTWVDCIKSSVSEVGLRCNQVYNYKAWLYIKPKKP